MTHASSRGSAIPLHRFPAVTVAACDFRPASRGTVRLRPADAADKPVIAPNYLATEADRRVAADAVRVTRRLMAQPRLVRHRLVERLRGTGVDGGGAALGRAAGATGTTIFHPVGTAEMGVRSDPSAVVDERLRVIGIEGLRVVDASVMPTTTSGDTDMPTIMIADRGRGWRSRTDDGRSARVRAPSRARGHARTRA